MVAITDQIADFIANTEFNNLSQSAVKKAKKLLLDAVGCGMGGARTKVGKTYRQSAIRLAGSGEATVFGTDQKITPAFAAFANAGQINAMDYDDTGPTGHPGSTTISAALAMAEKTKPTGKELLTSIVVGYEVLTLVGIGIQPTWERYNKVHGIGTHQTFGSFSAVAKILDLSPEEILNGLGIAGAFAPVPHAGKFGWENPPLSWVKDNVAWPSKAGLHGALLADEGFLGSRDMLDGKKGFWIMAGSDQSSLSRTIKRLGNFVITQTSIKPYPCCRWIHPSLDATQEIIEEVDLLSSNIERIEVDSVSFVANNFGDLTPKTMIDAEFSVPYCISSLIHGTPLPQWHSDNNLKDNEILKLASKVELNEREEFQNEYLEDRKEGRTPSFIPTKVVIIRKDGQELERTVRYARGGSKRPLSSKSLEQKFQSLSSWSLKDNTNEVIDIIDNLENIKDVTALTDKFSTNE